MQVRINTSSIISWVFATILCVIGVLNFILVHPVPGIFYLLLSILYAPPANELLRNRFNFSVPLALKSILFIFIIMFTLGVSDLGDMVD